MYNEENAYLNWKDTALYCQQNFGSFVDLEEKFYICPECGEPIYFEDWKINYPIYLCPVCENDYTEEECSNYIYEYEDYYEDYEDEEY